MNTTFNPCPVCLSFNPDEMRKVESVKSVDRVLCSRCNTIFFSTDPPSQTVYDKEYISRFFRTDYLKKAAFSAAYISDFARAYFQDPSILEVGIGNGIVSSLLRQFGYNVWGNDVDTDLLYFIKKKYDLPLLQGDFTQLKTDLRFDIIYSAQTLEHCNNPRAFFQKAFELLNQHGILIIETPDIKYHNQSLKRWHHFETRGDFEHLVMFSEQSLEYLANFTGLDPLFFHSDPVFQSIMAVYAKKGLNPARMGNLTPYDRFGRALGPVFFGQKF
jgi:SAM-dependent methyltransferase